MKKYKSRIPMDVPPNWPPVAGTVLWTDSLKKRLLFPLENINTFGHDITLTERADKVKRRAQTLVKELDAFREIVFCKWKEEVPSNIEHYLKESLLIVFHNKLIELNFHRQLVAALKEVRYLKLMDVDDLPSEALALFERNEEFHIWNVTLKKVTEWYNRMRLRAKPQEFDLVCDEITLIDFQINRINKEYRWESRNNWNQIKELHDIVWQLTDRMNQAQDNLQNINKLANQWNYFPLYNRAKGKKGNLLVYSDHQEICQRFLAIIKAGQTLYRLIDMNYHLLHNIPIENLESNTNEVSDKNIKETTDGSVKAEHEDDDHSDVEEGNEDIEDSDGAREEEDESSDDNKEHSVNDHQDPEQTPELNEDMTELTKPQSTGTQYRYLKSPNRMTRSTDEPKRKQAPARKCKSCQLNKYRSNSDGREKDEEGWFCFAPDDDEAESDEEVNFEKMPYDQPREIAFKIHEQWISERNKFIEQLVEEPVVPVHPIEIRNKRKALRHERDKANLLVLANRKSFGKSTETSREVSADHKDKGNEDSQTEPPSSIKDDEIVPAMSYSEKNARINELKKENWEKYVKMIDDMVFDGLLHATGAAFSFLIDQMEPLSKNGPLFEVKMQLAEPEIIFVPAMSDEPNDSIMSIITKIMGDIDVMPLLIPRVAHYNKTMSYMDDVIYHDDIVAMHSELIDKTKLAIQETENFVKPFYKYSYLWMENQSEHLSQFVRYSRLLTPEELELEDRNDEDGNPLLPTRLPTIDDFRKMIDSYDDLFKEISDMENDTMITAWIRIDLRMFKLELLNICSHWGMLYKQHLIDDIVAKLQELDQFIDEAMVELNKPLIKGDYDGLVNIMGYLLHVKQRQDETDNLFDPIREVITLLKSYGLDLSDQVYSLLGEMPDRWLNLKRLATQVRIMAQPLMQEESNTIRRRLNFFDVRQNLFKTRFKQKDFFNWECNNPYWSIDEAHEEVIDLEEMCDKLAEQAALFEVVVPEFKVLKQTRKDTKLIKVLWDYILVVRSWIYEWECTEWKKIDSESMDMELKKFAKEMRTMDKDMRNWELYLKLESIIKNMITALRAITELQNPAIRDRHWKQLMQATKVGARLEPQYSSRSKVIGLRWVADERFL